MVSANKEGVDLNTAVTNVTRSQGEVHAITGCFHQSTVVSFVFVLHGI